MENKTLLDQIESNTRKTSICVMIIMFVLIAQFVMKLAHQLFFVYLLMEN